MSDFPEQKSVPIWRIIIYGLFTAAAVASIGYWTHQPAMYVFSGVLGLIIGGIGLFFKSIQTSSQIRDSVERRKFAVRRQSIVLIIFKVLAIPSLVVGCVLIYDLFFIAPEHDTATVIGKSVGYTSRGGYSYYLQVEGLRVYQKSVPLWFYNDCSLNDRVELSLTPLFKDWHQVSLIRNGMVEASATPSDTYWMAFFAFGSLLPILLFVRPVRHCFGTESTVPFKDNLVGIYFLLVLLCEIVAIGVILKFICVLLGFSDAM